MPGVKFIHVIHHQAGVLLFQSLRVLCVFLRVLREPLNCVIRGFTKNTKEDTKNTKVKNGHEGRNSISDTSPALFFIQVT